MCLRTKPSSCPSRNNSAGRRAEQGYALIVMLMVVTILLVTLTAALPSIYQEGQREREEELLFRGNEYARAIALFYRQFRRYPVSVKELLSTNGLRFLRHPYPDPMTRQGKWRFIHAGPGGAILDSHTMSSGRRDQSAQGQSDRSSMFGQGTGSRSAFFSDSDQPRGASIVGVASMSKKESIRVWNGHTRYEDWEFLGTTFTPYSGVQLPSSAASSPGSSTSNPQPFSPSSPMGPSSPTRTFPNQ